MPEQWLCCDTCASDYARLVRPLMYGELIESKHVRHLDGSAVDMRQAARCDSCGDECGFTVQLRGSPRMRADEIWVPH